MKLPQGHSHLKICHFWAAGQVSSTNLNAFSTLTSRCLFFFPGKGDWTRSGHILNLLLLRNTDCLQLLVSLCSSKRKDRAALFGQKECLLLLEAALWALIGIWGQVYFFVMS